MKEYVKNPAVHHAEQWLGHGKPFELDGVEVEQEKGLSGYSAKLGYIQVSKDFRATVRPSEYVIKDPNGKIYTLDPHSFENEFVEKVAKPAASRNTKTKAKTVEDNVEESLI